MLYITAAEELFLWHCSTEYRGQRREGVIMYGQVSRKRRTEEVRLVRMSQFDSRIRGGYDGGSRRFDRIDRSYRRRFRRMLSLLCPMFLLMIAGIFSGVRFVLADESVPASVMVTESVQLPGDVSAEPGETETGEVGIILPEELEPQTPLVVIDPGHGGMDEGCIGDGVLEKEVNLQLARLLADKLREMGIDAVLTREDDISLPTLEERVRLAEDQGADIFVSIHQNACEEESANGIETWYCGDNADSRRLAQLVNMGTLDKTGAKERGLMESSELYVIRESSMPSCLIETGFLSNSKECEALSDPAYQEKVAAGIAWGIQYYFYPKTMYLTFDDGPSQENTSAVLDILKQRGIKATFFVVGENVRRHPEIAKRIVEEGHTIGIHCDQHDYNKLYTSVESYLEDFQKAFDTVYEVTGVEVKFFRFPGGSINAYNKDVYEEIIAEMTERGFIYFDWNGSLEDASKDNAPEKLIKNARESTLGRKKVVMLAHDIKYNTMLCLDELIDQFPEYKMEPLTEDVKPIQF